MAAVPVTQITGLVKRLKKRKAMIKFRKPITMTGHGKKFRVDTIRSNGILERCCSHGISHVIGNMDSSKLKDVEMWLHSCDGCCRKWRRQT
jgi:hypothetical protein